MNETRIRKYAEQVTGVLAAEFPGDLADPQTRDLVTRLITRLAAGEVHEVIVDNPVLANWRLYPCHGGVRLACTRLHPTPRDDDRESRVNMALTCLT